MGDGPPFGLICGCICCVAALITLIVVLAVSFHSLDQLDLGLNYNSITLQVEETVYTSAGLFFLGPGHYFVKYPKTVQLVDFVASGNGPECSNCDGYEILACRTSDGLPVYLSISFQFRYDEARLRDNFLLYEQREYVCDDKESFKNCYGIYQDTARTVLSNVGTNYTAFEFFNDKNAIALAMQMRIAEVFFNEMMAIVDSFQITRVELPAQFQNALLASIEAKQNITFTQQYKANMEVTFQTQALVANQTRQQTIATAIGTANQRAQQAAAKAAIVEQTVAAEMNAYGNFTEIVGLDVAEGVDYIWWSSQTSLPGKEYLVGVDPQAFIRASPPSPTSG